MTLEIKYGIIRRFRRDGESFISEGQGQMRQQPKEWVSVESLQPEINKIYSLAYGSKLKNEYYDIEEIIKKIKKELKQDD